jgi:hypothetical protein
LLTLDDLSIIVRAPRDITFNDHVFPVHESKLRNMMGTLFSEVEKDTEMNPHQDYIDFYVPNPIALNSGGVESTISSQTLPFTPPLQLRDPNTPATPEITPTLCLPDSSPLTPGHEVILIKSSPENASLDAHFGGNHKCQRKMLLHLIKAHWNCNTCGE